MKGSVNISDYFYGAKTQFIIPLYQRKYAWQKKHCVRLFEDLIKIHKEELQSHFSEVLLQQSQRGWRRFADYRWSAAYHNFIAPDSGRFQCSCQWRYATWQWRYWGSKENYLYAIRKRIDRQIKLRPIEGDIEAYDALFTNNSDDFIKNTGITANYELFTN